MILVIFYAGLSSFSSTQIQKANVVVENPLWQQVVQKLLSEVAVKNFNQADICEF